MVALGDLGVPADPRAVLAARLPVPLPRKLQIKKGPLHKILGRKEVHRPEARMAA